MVTKTLQRARDTLQIELPEGGAFGEDYWMNGDDLDSVGVVDLFCHEELEDDSTDDLVVDIGEDISSPVSPGNFPFSSLITPRTFQLLGAGLDFDLTSIFEYEEEYQQANGQYEFASEYGLSLAIDSNQYRGFNLGQFVSDSIYSLVSFSPFSTQSSSPKSFFGENYF